MVINVSIKSEKSGKSGSPKEKFETLYRCCYHCRLHDPHVLFRAVPPSSVIMLFVNILYKAKLFYVRYFYHEGGIFKPVAYHFGTVV